MQLMLWKHLDVMNTDLSFFFWVTSQEAQLDDVSLHYCQDYKDVAHNSVFLFFFFFLLFNHVR